MSEREQDYRARHVAKLEADRAKLRLVKEGLVKLANVRTVDDLLAGVRLLAGAGLSLADEELGRMEERIAGERGG